MVRIGVFDSGLGSLSIIRPIQQLMKCQIIYFADSRNFPYGRKSIDEIRQITTDTINLLKNSFTLDCIIVGSNTLSFTIKPNKQVFLVLPPLLQAEKISKSKNIGILATESIVNSTLLDDYIKKMNIPNCSIFKINASPIIDLVESGKFLSDTEFTRKKVLKYFERKFIDSNIDAVTLSSTHLPFVKNILEDSFCSITFLDPAETIAKNLQKSFPKNKSKRNTMKVYSSKNAKFFQKKLEKFGIKKHVKKFPN